MYARRPVFHPIANNGLIVGGSNGFLFECISNSSQSPVGMITGLDQSTLTADHPFNRPGVVRFQTKSSLPLPPQGIYTCTIPDSNNNSNVINVGVYPTGFSGKLWRPG